MDEFVLTLWLLFTTLLVFPWFIYSFKSSSRSRSLPPSPPRLPILGNLHQLGRTKLVHRTFHSLATKYGSFILLHFGSQPVLLVQSSAAASQIMKINDLTFADKPSTKTTRRLFYNNKDISITPYGDYWRKLKSFCVLQLLSLKRVQSFRFIREEETALLVDKIRAASQSGLPSNLSELFTSLANDVVCRSAFGRKYSEGDDGRKFLRVLQETMELIGSSTRVGEFVPWLSWIDLVNGYNRRVDRVAREVDDFLEQVMHEHELNAGKRGVNFVDILLEIYTDNNTGVHIDRETIKAIILDMLAGGTDTTSATMEWAMTELFRHPNVLRKLQHELRAILGGNTRDITNEDIDQMHYLKAVVKETLRVHPPIPFMGRVARQDVQVMGYDIAAGTFVIANSWAIGRDPASWGDDAELFKPERFLDCSIDFKGLDFELIPFGAGRRSCPGIGFAMASVELVLANLVHKFEWQLGQDTEWECLDTAEHPGLTIHRENPLIAIATEYQF